VSDRLARRRARKGPNRPMEWEPVDYVLHLGIPKDARARILKAVGEAESFIKSAHRLLVNAENMDKGGYDVPELSILNWMLEGCLMIIRVLEVRLGRQEV